MLDAWSKSIGLHYDKDVMTLYTLAPKELFNQFLQTCDVFCFSLDVFFFATVNMTNIDQPLNLGSFSDAKSQSGSFCGSKMVLDHLSHTQIFLFVSLRRCTQYTYHRLLPKSKPKYEHNRVAMQLAKLVCFTKLAGRLVVWNIWIIFLILEMSSSQLTNSYFSEG